MLFSKAAGRTAPAPLALPIPAPSRLSAADIDGRDAVFANRQVRHAALGLLHAADAAKGHAGRVAIELAIQACGPDVDRVLQRLQAWTDVNGSQGAKLEAAFADLDAQHKALTAVRAPLRAAVAARCTELRAAVAEVNRDREALNCHGRRALPATALRAAALEGLTPEEVAAVAAVQRTPPPMPTHEQLNDRVFELARQIKPLESFLADSDVKHLDGLGFEALIEARRHAEAAA